MDVWKQTISVLPEEIRRVLENLPAGLTEQVQEIRFRKNRPITLSLPQKDHLISELICTGQTLYNMFLHLCEYSVHSHQSELQQGYISAKNGCRVGVSGTAVLENGRVVSVRDIMGLCFRIARHHPNSAKEIAFTIKKERLHSLLLCGGPASGKTSLLRDLIQQLTACDGRPCRLAVVDERRELILQPDPACEVLTGFPKSVGIEQALRTLSPEGIVFDELGDEEEVKAVLHSLNSGVASICSVHADSPDTLRRRPAAHILLQSGAFDYVAFLSGRHQPGIVQRILLAKEIAC